MVVYDAIFAFLKTYIFNGGFITDDFDAWMMVTSFLVEGTDGRLVIDWSAFFLPINLIYFSCHLLTLFACISLCVMLWKLITLPIKWAIKRAE